MKLKISDKTEIIIGQSLAGFIFDDTRGKFLDGEFVRTSPVVSQVDNKIHTRNSVYEIVRVSQQEIIDLVVGDQ